MKGYEVPHGEAEWVGGGQSLPRGGQGGIKSNDAGKVSNAATASEGETYA